MIILHNIMKNDWSNCYFLLVATRLDELTGSLDKINGQNMDFAEKFCILILMFFSTIYTCYNMIVLLMNNIIWDSM